MSDKATQKGLRDTLGDGYLNLLDSVRHSFEQATWGQENSGNLADDFYRWVGPAEDAAEPAAPKAIDAAELGQGVEVRAAEVETSQGDRNEFEAWIDGKREAMGEREIAPPEQERNGPELGE